MRIAIPAKGKDANAELDERFGRCKFFVIVNTDTDDIEYVENSYQDAGGGAGVQVGQFLCGRDVEAVIVNNVGPKAMSVLQAADISVYSSTDSGGTVLEVLEKLKNKELRTFDRPTVEVHGFKETVEKPGEGG